MNDWFELHQTHRALRAQGGSSLRDIRRVLHQLIKRKHADASLISRFTDSKNPETGRRDWYITAPRSAIKAKEWAEPLRKLSPDIAEANLTILALTDTSNTRLGKLSVMIEGKSITSGPFVVAAHLDDRHMGSGACGHSLFHCHVGPSFETPPAVRVPLPALRPAATLEWALSVVLPDWEPVPWSNVDADTERRRAQGLTT